MRFLAEKKGSVVVETAVILPLMALLLFFCVDLSRFFALRLQMDEYANAIAVHITKTNLISSAEIAKTNVLLTSKTGMKNVNFKQNFTLKTFAPDGSLRRELLYSSGQGMIDCEETPLNMGSENTGNVPFFPEQKLISVTLCVSLNGQYFLTPILRLLDLTFRSTSAAPFSFLGRRVDDEIV